MTLIEMSLSASLLILAIVVIRSLAVHSLPKVTFLVLWGVALVRLFVPFSILSPFHNRPAFDSPTGFFSQLFSPAAGTTSQATTLQPITNPTPPAGIPITTNLILIVWGTGLIACTLFFLIPHFKSLRAYQAALPIDLPWITHWLRAQETRRTVKIRQFDQISAPLTYGVFRPVILLPKRMNWTDEKQIRYILTHELTHIKRFDTLWKWLLAASLCIHWFNPLVWVMYVLANRDIEISCDEAVVSTYGNTQKSSYALTLIGMEEKRSFQTLLSNNFSKNAIKERIQSIMKLKKASRIGLLVAGLLVFAAVIVFAATGPIRIFQSGSQNSHALVAMPVQQATSPGVVTSSDGNSQARPVLGQAIDLTTLYSQAVGLSSAKDLIKSTSPRDQSKASPYSSIVIRFNQDMDINSLDGDNIIVVDDKHSTIITYAFNFNYDEKSRELHLDMKPEMKPTLKQPSMLGLGKGNTVRVFLTTKVKTADGKSIEHEYEFTYHT